MGLTLQDLWKLTSLELAGFHLAVLLNQPWLISFLVVACFLGAQALACARDARKSRDRRNRCGQGRASAASPRQKASLRQLGGATAPLRPLLVLCHLSAVSAQLRLATNVECLPKRDDEALLDFSGAKPQRFLHCAHPPAERARIVPVPQGRACCTTTWAALPVTAVRRKMKTAI